MVKSLLASVMEAKSDVDFWEIRVILLILFFEASIG